MILAADLAPTVVGGSLLLAVPVAVLAGLVSFASPCVLPLVPGYLGLLGGTLGGASGPRTVLGLPDATGVVRLDPRRAGAATVGGTAAATGAPPAPGPDAVAGDAVPLPHAAPAPRAAGRGRTLAGVGLFVAGFTVVFVAYGALAGSLGAALWQWQDTVGRVLGVLVVLLGLTFVGAFRFLQVDVRPHVAPRAGLWGAPVLGVAFGIGWTPCIGPTLAAILTLSLTGGSAGRGALLAVAFCVGLGLPFLLVALGLTGSRRALAVLSRHRVAVMRVGGAMLVVLGLALVTGVWTTWAAWLQGLLTGSEPFVPVL
ncbi:cytochrome c biogenesis CcdA family protein [Cellulomonas sp. SLBN-39]|uniref:cytochrome c biogenesis CcdA family protein n=1 Tax=Cellulomonas sp. SLBN-39 TaxID=2768446 RepID=UPI00114E86D9|nr:cytochrome c biogenesis protein CcdA [Cellulomonas sp. SLBN-39]TQL03289.1 cytochrome c-type biogenesis protein [Cellulomonas sp. SLBN-39]